MVIAWGDVENFVFGGSEDAVEYSKETGIRN